MQARGLLAVLLLGGTAAAWWGAPREAGVLAGGPSPVAPRRAPPVRADGARVAEVPARLGHAQPAPGPSGLNREEGDALTAEADAIREGDVPSRVSALTPDELRLPCGARLFERWVETQPAAAALWAWQQEERGLREELLCAAAARWAAEDAAAAVAWVDSLAPGHESRDRVRAIAAASLVESHPMTALRLALELPDEDNSRALVAPAAAAQWAKADAHAATEWVQAFPPGAFRDRLAGSVATALASDDAPAALRLALENLPAGDAQDAAVIAIVQQAGPAAGALHVSATDEMLSGTNLPVVIALWTARDPAAAGAWLGGLPDGPQRDAGIAAHAMVLAGGENTAAFTWAGRIADPDLRGRSIDYIRGLLR